MLDRRFEYEKMAAVEEHHWWYQSLHCRVLDAVRDAFVSKHISVLDAGCGTGGLMLYLKKHGYTNISGFDLSEDAVRICREKGLNVFQNDIRNMGGVSGKDKYDVIISNDTLYFLSQDQIRQFILSCFSLLTPGGILIANVPALSGFSGIHDLSVGIKKRFSQKEIRKMCTPLNCGFVRMSYWPFFLSPVIFLVRTWQRWKLSHNPGTEIASDIEMPPPWANTLLKKICDLEKRWPGNTPVGSSVFFVLSKKSWEFRGHHT